MELELTAEKEFERGRPFLDLRPHGTSIKVLNGRLLACKDVAG